MNCFVLSAFVGGEGNNSRNVSLRETPPKAEALGPSLLQCRGWHGFLIYYPSLFMTKALSLCANGETGYDLENIAAHGSGGGAHA